MTSPVPEENKPLDFSQFRSLLYRIINLSDVLVFDMRSSVKWDAREAIVNWSLQIGPQTGGCATISLATDIAALSIEKQALMSPNDPLVRLYKLFALNSSRPMGNYFHVIVVPLNQGFLAELFSVCFPLETGSLALTVHSGNLTPEGYPLLTHFAHDLPFISTTLDDYVSS